LSVVEGVFFDKMI